MRTLPRLWEGNWFGDPNHSTLLIAGSCATKDYKPRQVRKEAAVVIPFVCRRGAWLSTRFVCGARADRSEAVRPPRQDGAGTAGPFDRAHGPEYLERASRAR